MYEKGKTSCLLRWGYVCYVWLMRGWREHLQAGNQGVTWHALPFTDQFSVYPTAKSRYTCIWAKTKFTLIWTKSSFLERNSAGRFSANFPISRRTDSYKGILKFIPSYCPPSHLTYNKEPFFGCFSSIYLIKFSWSCFIKMQKNVVSYFFIFWPFALSRESTRSQPDAPQCWVDIIHHEQRQNKLKKTWSLLM